MIVALCYSDYLISMMRDLLNGVFVYDVTIDSTVDIGLHHVMVLY